jgi:hypothetical protein
MVISGGGGHHAQPNAVTAARESRSAIHLQTNTAGRFA